MASTERLRLPRSARLRRRPDFEGAYRDGIKVVRRPFILFVRCNELQTTRLGVTATRKIGNSPVRNRARRVIKEAFRTFRQQLPGGYDFVVVVRPSLLEMSPKQLAPELERTIREVLVEARAS